MSNFPVVFTNNFLPEAGAPFYNNLKELFCAGKKDIGDLSIHYPNVIRFIENLVIYKGRQLIKDRNDDDINEAEAKIVRAMPDIEKYLEMNNPELKRKKTDFLMIAALYHDIGKIIRQANHPRHGFNILRHMDDKEQSKLVSYLVMKDDQENSKSNEDRFSLLCSIVDHHDKFGVVSTGEASLALFSDILYFRSDEKSITGIKENITSVMLISLADIAAVCTADEKKQKRASELVSAILEDRSLIQSDAYTELCGIWEDTASSFKLNTDKVGNILDDWDELIKAVNNETVHGDRTKFREYLIRLDQNPYRAIKRFIRLIKECCHSAKCDFLLPHISETDIETTLVGFFGAHPFHDFCIKFAYIVKMDYGLRFFKGILCAYIRNNFKVKFASIEEGEWSKINENETKILENLTASERQDIIKDVSKIFIKVINRIIGRYSYILDIKIESAYRLGLQMRTLTDDVNVRSRILQYLCSVDEKKDHVALTWIADEVTFWSMD